MGDFDIDAAIRWASFDPQATLARRSDEEHPFVGNDRTVGPALFLDTCVYIDQVQGRAPEIVERLTQTRQVNHAMGAIQEFVHSVGVLDPGDARTASVVAVNGRLVRAMRPHRIFTPEPDVLGRAALLAGILCRLKGYATANRLRALQDCTLFLQSQKLGLTVLTRNIIDFYCLLQLMPKAQILFYRHNQ